MAVLHHPELKSSRFILGSGSGTRWPEIDEDISVAGMLHDIPPEGRRHNAKRLPYACSLRSCFCASRLQRAVNGRRYRGAVRAASTARAYIWRASAGCPRPSSTCP